MKTATGVAACLAMVCVLASAASAAVATKAVEYQDGEVALEGYLAWDDAATGPRPAVLVVHEWWGLNDYAKMRARQLAAMGYVAFAVDMYGKGILADTPEKARALAATIRSGRTAMRRRITAGLDVLRTQADVDPKRIAAIGYCFGGTTVLELARSGADVAGVVSFHGGLDTDLPAEAGKVTAKVLVLTGAADPGVTHEHVKTFQDEMTQAGTDWHLVSYGGAVHTFTNPAAGNDASKGSAYHPVAARRSWEAMKTFFAELFAPAAQVPDAPAPRPPSPPSTPPSTGP
jgi:dienelactone hydrolase